MEQIAGRVQTLGCHWELHPDDCGFPKSTILRRQLDSLLQPAATHKRLHTDNPSPPAGTDSLSDIPDSSSGIAQAASVHQANTERTKCARRVAGSHATFPKQLIPLIDTLMSTPNELRSKADRSTTDVTLRSKTARPRKASGRKKAAPPVSFREHLLIAVFRPRILLAIGLLAATAVLAPALGRLMPDLSQRSEYRLRSSEIQIPDPPSWVPASLVEQVCERSELPDELSVLEEDLAQRIAEAFEQHPWVEGRVNVQLSVPAAIRVDFEYRKPVAMVAIGGGFYPVDNEGTLLPPRDFAPSQVERFPVITGIERAPTRRAGASWGDQRVTGAARLAVVLVPYWREWKLKAIEVPPRPDSRQSYDELEFTLTTQGGSRINWGLAPGHRHPLEITEEQKIGRMKKFLARGQAFDRPWEIDLNNFMEVNYRPLEARNRRVP